MHLNMFDIDLAKMPIDLNFSCKVENSLNSVQISINKKDDFYLKISKQIKYLLKNSLIWF